MTDRAGVARSGKATAGTARKRSKGTRRAPRDPHRRAFEFDRIVVLRIVLVVVVLAFFVLIGRIAMQAFGSGAATEARRMERIIGGANEADRKATGQAKTEKASTSRP